MDYNQAYFPINYDRLKQTTEFILKSYDINKDINIIENNSIIGFQTSVTGFGSKIYIYGKK
jgi:hypothetical protein